MPVYIHSFRQAGGLAIAYYSALCIAVAR